MESAFLPRVNVVPGGRQSCLPLPSCRRMLVAWRSGDQGRLATAGGDYVVADVTPKCREPASLFGQCCPRAAVNFLKVFCPMQDAMYD